MHIPLYAIINMQVFYFKFLSDYAAVTVSVTSNKSEAIGCAYVSVQNNSVSMQ